MGLPGRRAPLHPLPGPLDRCARPAGGEPRDARGVDAAGDGRRPLPRARGRDEPRPRDPPPGRRRRGLVGGLGRGPRVLELALGPGRPAAGHAADRLPRGPGQAHPGAGPARRPHGGRARARAGRRLLPAPAGRRRGRGRGAARPPPSGRGARGGRRRAAAAGARLPRPGPRRGAHHARGRAPRPRPLGRARRRRRRRRSAGAPRRTCAHPRRPRGRRNGAAGPREAGCGCATRPSRWTSSRPGCSSRSWSSGCAPGATRPPSSSRCRRARARVRGTWSSASPRRRPASRC